MRTPSILLAATLALATLGAAPATAGRGLSSASAAHQRSARQQSERYGVATLTPTQRKVRHRGKTNRVFPAVVAATGEAVFARLPRQGVSGAMRRHAFARTLVDQLGWPELVPPAGELTLASDIGGGEIDLGGYKRKVGQGDKVMLVPDLGTDFVTLKELEEDGRAATVQSAFPEELRLTGAVLHLLTWQLDGNTANVMIRQPAGRAPGPDDVRVLDHDVTLGIKHTGPKINGSVFFADKSLPYASRQASVRDLPRAARHVVEDLAGSTPADIASAYGLELDEAALVMKTAKDIEANGLTTAIDHFWAESPSFHDTDYHRRKREEKLR
jgi:hypothetical protein